MWLFTKFGFYSITKAERTKKKNLFQVRARCKEDLLNLKKNVPCLEYKKIHWDGMSDYRYRIYVFKNEVSEIMLVLADKLDYSNFKNKIASLPDQAEKYGFYSKVWGVMYGYQKFKEEQGHRKELEGFYGQQINVFDHLGIDEIDEIDEQSEHIRDERADADIPPLREELFTEEQWRKLNGG